MDHVLATDQLLTLALGAIAFGFYLLVKGGDWAIDGAVAVAERAGLSKLFVGATILAFGTSVPELFASINANLSGFPGLSLGNVIGSNIANILLVLGAVTIIVPIRTSSKALNIDLLTMVGASLILVALMQGQVISQLAGFGLLAIVVVLVGYQYWSMQRQGPAALDAIKTPETAPSQSTWLAILAIVGGIVALAVGSELLVAGAVTIGNVLSVPEAVIGLTVVAFGTSLPELATCVLAAMKRETSMLVGNVIGSNTFNILFIVGMTAGIKPIGVDSNLAGLELYGMLAVSVLLAVLLMVRLPLGRMFGILAVISYLSFTISQYLFAGQ